MPTRPLEVKYCIVCEAARQEIGGKASLLGFFGLTPDVNVLVPQTPIQLPFTFFLVCKGGDNKKHSGRAMVIAPDGKEIGAAALPEVLISASGDPGGVISIAFQSMNLPVPGRYTFKLLIDDNEIYSTSFAITRDQDLYKAALNPMH